MPNTQDTDNTTVNSFLPDFCHPVTVLLIILIAELLALVLTLADGRFAYGSWQRLGIISLYVQWIALCTTSTLCLNKKRLAHRSPKQVASFTFVVILTFTLLINMIDLLASTGLFFWQYQTEQWLYLAKILTMTLIIAMVVLRYLYLQMQYRQKLASEASAKMQALTARIKPHFLFNSLNTIASLASIDPEQAEEATVELSDLFRASLSESRELVTLGRELELCRAFMHIEQLRMADRLTVEWDIGQTTLTQMIPPLTLQPLLENAVIHGIAHRPEGGKIKIEAIHQGAHVLIRVTNPMPEKREGSAGTNTALKNIENRLQLAFHDLATIGSTTNEGFWVSEISLPRQEGA